MVDWVNGRNNIQVPQLQHLLVEIQNLKALFRRTLFAHIYRELNEKFDNLSKQYLAYQPSVMEVEEVANGVSTLRYEAI